MRVFCVVIYTRMIQLMRSPLNISDTHVITEVYDSQVNEYIALDSTFCVMYKKITNNSRFIGAMKIRDYSLYKNEETNIKIVKFCNTSCDIDNYYVDYYSLFNHVFITEYCFREGIFRFISKFPILYNYYGGKYYSDIYMHENSLGIFYNSLYFILSFIIIILFLSFLLFNFYLK